MAFQKIPSYKKVDKYQFSVINSCVAAILAFTFLFSHINFNVTSILYALVWAFGFSVLGLLQIHALYYSSTSNVFPFTSLLSNVFVVIGGVSFLNDKISGLQFAAILLAISLVFYSTYKNKLTFSVNILPLFLAISLLSTFNKFVQKFGAIHTEIYNFIFWQLLFTFIYSFIFMFFKKRSFKLDVLNKSMINYGVISGVFAFLTTFFIVKALETGPTSLVYIIIGTYTFFTSLIAHFIFKEELTRRNIIFIFLSIFVVLLIKLG